MGLDGRSGSRRHREKRGGKGEGEEKGKRRVLTTWMLSEMKERKERCRPECGFSFQGKVKGPLAKGCWKKEAFMKRSDNVQRKKKQLRTDSFGCVLSV